MTDVVHLTQKLVQCPSITPEDAGAQDILKNELKKLGFEVFDLPFDGNGSYPVQNFFARLGNSAPHICYAGHTDVVPAENADQWTHPPFDAVTEDGIMYGRGTSDMKGGNAAFLSAISNFLQTNKDFQGSISFLITGDEEADAINGTVRVLEWMKDNDHIPDVCLVGESSNIKELGEEIKIGRRGSLNGNIIIHGKAGHVAYPEFAQNPIPTLSQIANTLSNYEFDQGSENFPPTNLEISTIQVENKARNVIPGRAEIQFNVRFNTNWTKDTLTEKIKNVILDISDNFTIETFSNASPFLTNDKKWLRIVEDAVYKNTGKQPKLSTSGGTSDARFIAPYCPVVEFGLTNETIHQVDECLKISDLEKLVIIYQEILENFLNR
ncbi:MAG: succinyl-diaminopimelate desuccinylase [Pseudomonadota bacterium]